MASVWNATMHYLSLFFHYHNLDELDLATLPLSLFNKTKKMVLGYNPVLNVPRSQAFLLHMAVQLLKNFIVAHGMVKVFPKWVSFTTFPALVMYYYYAFRIGEHPLEWIVNLYHFVFLWTLVIRHRFSIDAQYLFLVWGFTVGEWPLLRHYCLGFQFAINISAILVLAWFAFLSIRHEHFSLPFILFAGAIFYHNINRTADVPEVFYTFIFLMGLGFYGCYLASRGDNKEMMLYLGIVSSICLLLCYNIALNGFSGPKYGIGQPFTKLPTFDRGILDASKYHEYMAEEYKALAQSVGEPLTVEELEREGDLMFEEFEAAELARQGIAKGGPLTEEELRPEQDVKLEPIEADTLNRQALAQGRDEPIKRKKLRHERDPMFEAIKAATLKREALSRGVDGSVKKEGLGRVWDLMFEAVEDPELEQNVLFQGIERPYTEEEFQRKRILMKEIIAAAKLEEKVLVKDGPLAEEELVRKLELMFEAVEAAQQEPQPLDEVITQTISEEDLRRRREIVFKEREAAAKKRKALAQSVDEPLSALQRKRDQAVKTPELENRAEVLARSEDGPIPEDELRCEMDPTFKVVESAKLKYKALIKGLDKSLAIKKLRHEQELVMKDIQAAILKSKGLDECPMEDLEREQDIVLGEIEVAMLKYEALIHHLDEFNVERPRREEDLAFKKFKSAKRKYDSFVQGLDESLPVEELEIEQDVMFKDIDAKQKREDLYLDLDIRELLREQDLLFKEIEASSKRTKSKWNKVTESTLMPVEESSTSKPEVESVIYTPDADGAPDPKAGGSVKYRGNKTMLY